MSVAFSLERIDSINEKSSLGEVAPLIKFKRRKARSLESGEAWPGRSSWHLEATFARSPVAPSNLQQEILAWPILSTLSMRLACGDKSQKTILLRSGNHIHRKSSRSSDLHLPQGGTCPDRPRVPLPEIVDTGRVPAGL